MTNCDVTGTVSKNDSRYGADQVTLEEEELLEEEQAIDFDPIEAEEQCEEEEEEDDDMIRVYPYDVPRPALTIEEASSILGKSVRSIERSMSSAVTTEPLCRATPMCVWVS